MNKEILKSQDISTELLTILKMNKGYTTESVDALLDKVKDTVEFYENYYKTNESYLKKFKPKVSMFENHMEELKARVENAKLAGEKAEREAKAQYAFYERRGEDELYKAEQEAKSIIDKATSEAERIKLEVDASNSKKINDAKSKALNIISEAEQEKRQIVDYASSEASNITKQATDAAEELKNLVRKETQELLDSTVTDAERIKNEALEKAQLVIMQAEKIEAEIKRKDEISKEILTDLNNKINYFSDLILSNFNDVKDQTKSLLENNLGLSKLVTDDDGDLDNNSSKELAEHVETLKTTNSNITSDENKIQEDSGLNEFENLDDISYLEHIENMSKDL